MTGKKRKNYYSGSGKNYKKFKGVLTVGVKGFLCTSNQKEKESIREAFNLLEEYSDVSATADNGDQSKEKDFDEELKKELDEMKKGNKPFQVLETGAKGLVFIKTTVEDPVQLVESIMEDLNRKKFSRSRFLLRLIPVEVTCKAYIDDIKKAADGMFDKYFKGEPTTYSVFYNKRNNDSLLRDEVIDSLALLVRDRNPEHKVNLKHSKKTIIVEVIKGVCCLSVVNDFFHFKKYNLLEVVKREEKKPVGATESPVQITKPEEDVIQTTTDCT